MSAVLAILEISFAVFPVYVEMLVVRGQPLGGARPFLVALTLRLIASCRAACATSVFEDRLRWTAAWRETSRRDRDLRLADEAEDRRLTLRELRRSRMR